MVQINNNINIPKKLEKKYHELLKCLVPSSATPLILIDNDGIIVKTNKAYENWCGISANELVGNHITKFVDNTRTHIVAKNGIPELQQVQKCFGKVILSSRIPIFDLSGKLIGAWGIVDVEDYSKIVKLYRRIEIQKNQIEQYKAELSFYKMGKYNFNDIIGESEEIKNVKKDALIAAQSNIDVIIRGETGTGKELFAHSIHNASLHSTGPFISVNCSALSYNLIESELFGYEGGSFTNADKAGRKGKFELANGGTIFLDEIGDLPLDMQPKILRAIENREITRVGGNDIIQLDIQIISATNRNLEDMIKQSMFREDLYFRLTSFIIDIPPLRERKDDIPVLIMHFIDKWCKTNKFEPKGFSEKAMTELINYDWPGNVRELFNYVRNAIVRTPLESRSYIYNLHFSNKIISDIKPIETYENHNLSLIKAILKQTHGNVKQSAEILQIDRNTLYRKIKNYKINLKEYRSGK